MSYADQKMGGNRLVVLIIVAALHVVLAYGLVTGLAFEAVKQVTKRVTTIDIEEPDEPEVEPPPPPPEQKQVAPPPVAVGRGRASRVLAARFSLACSAA